MILLLSCSGFARAVADSHRSGKDGGVWNDDLPSLSRSHDGRTGLELCGSSVTRRNSVDGDAVHGQIQCTDDLHSLVHKMTSQGWVV